MTTIKMTIDDYNKVIDSINRYRDNGKKILDITNETNLVQISDTSMIDSCISKLQNLVTNADSILVDFYHILGMGNLDSAKTVKLTFLVKKVILIRSCAKDRLPKVIAYRAFINTGKSKTSTYNTKVLSPGLVLCQERKERKL